MRYHELTEAQRTTFLSYYSELFRAGRQEVEEWMKSADPLLIIHTAQAHLSDTDQQLLLLHLTS